MAASIRAELKRFQRRKQLQYSCNMDTNSDGSSSGGENSESSPSRSDKPIFTFKQVSFIFQSYFIY